MALYGLFAGLWSTRCGTWVMAMPCWIATCEAHGHQEGTPESVVMLSFRAASQGGFTKLPGFAEMEVRARCSEAAAKRSFRYGVRRKWKWWHGPRLRFLGSLGPDDAPRQSQRGSSSFHASARDPSPPTTLARNIHVTRYLRYSKALPRLVASNIHLSTLQTRASDFGRVREVVGGGG